MVIERLMPDFPKQQLYKCLRLIDINKDGSIDQNEFMMLFIDKETDFQSK